MTTASDRLLYRVTGGKLSLMRASRIPALMLVVTRPDGVDALIPLQYVSLDGIPYAVGTNWGRVNHPLWSSWLKRNPRCAVNIRGCEYQCRAVFVEDQPREDIWPRLVEKTPYYAQCQRRVQRELRLFRFETVD
jgi:deazaflavin-dependent oxidoreductase (nitroreductase family)